MPTGDRLLPVGGLVLNRFVSDMLNLIGGGGGDAIAAESSADSSLMSVMKLYPLPFLAYLTRDVTLLVFRSEPIAFFSREVS